jgi:cell division protein FtsB
VRTVSAVERDRSARVQQQWVISFVVVIAMLALLAGLYLNITASASIAGRQIQALEAEITANEQVNADLETRIATLMSNAILEERAEALGFVPVERSSLQYMVVPGYFPPQPINMVSASNVPQAVSTSPEFNETLIDWISKQIELASIPLAESGN